MLNKDAVTMKQEVFCQEYIDSVGNGTRAAIKAFDIKNKEVVDVREKDRTDAQVRKYELVINTAATMANEYLRKPNIIKRIDDILEERGFTDETVKREHYKLIRYSEPSIRMKAIESYYKLKGKNAAEKVEVTLPTPLLSNLDNTNVPDNTSNKEDSETQEED